MTTTYDFGEAGYGGGSYALSFVIEGFDTVFATQEDGDLANAYNNDAAPYDQFTTLSTGMKVRGNLKSSIKLYAPDIEPDSVEVSIVDHASALIGSLFRENSSAGNTTFITSNVVAGSTASIAVQPIATFATSGDIYIGGERIGYTGVTTSGGKTASFTGITRAKYGVNLCNDGTTRFSPSHLIGNNVSPSARTAPAVTDYPRTWYGRFCHLFLHVKDPLTGNFNAPSEATKIVTGRIDSYRDEGDGTITITIKTCVDLLSKPIGPDQWRANLNEGSYLDGTQDTLFLHRAGAASYRVSTAMGLSGTYSHAQIAAIINAEFIANTWDSGGTTAAGDAWRLELLEPGDGGPSRYRIRVAANTTAFTTDWVWFGLNSSVMNLLGFTQTGGNGSVRDATTNDFVQKLQLSSVTASIYELWADKPPIIYHSEAPRMDSATATVMELSNEINTFVTQATTDSAVPPDVNGVVQIEGGEYAGVYAVRYTNGSPSRLAFYGVLNPETGHFEQRGIGYYRDEPVRLGDQNSVQPTVKQVLYYRGTAGELLLKLLLSSGGASGYNHASYDTLTTASFGAGVPASLIDIPSWEDLDDVQFGLVVGNPQPFYKLLEPVLAVSNRYVVWKPANADSQPKLSIVRPSLDSTFFNSWTLNESNKCDNERTKVERGADGIVNRVVVKYGHGMSGSADTGNSANMVTLTAEDLASQSDYGRRRTVTIDAPAVLNVPSVVGQTIAVALTYFSRPVATAERSFNASLMRMAPGDTATLIDNYVVDPASGARGATLYGWVLDTTFDLGTGKGQCRVVFLPEKNIAYTAPWAPSARVDETAAGGGYNTATKVLTLKQHEFSYALDVPTPTADPLRFSDGDKIHIYELDSDTPDEWYETINGAPTATTITVTTGLNGEGGGDVFTSAKRYVVEFDDINTVVASQRSNASFVADVATLSTGYSTPTPYEFGQIGWTFNGRPSPVYTTGMPKFRGTSVTLIPGEPCSSHNMVYLARGLNAHFKYRSRTVHLSEYLGDQSVTGTTETLRFMAWVPIFGHIGVNGTRGLLVRLRGRQSGGGTATFTISSAPVACAGASYTSFTYPMGRSTQQFATTSATNEWSSELALTCQPGGANSANGTPGTWIIVQARGSAGGITATFNQIWVAEATA